MSANNKFAELKRMIEEHEFRARKPDLEIAIEDETVIGAASHFFMADKVRAQAMLDIGIQCRKLEHRMFEELRLKYPQLQDVHFCVNYNEMTGDLRVLVFNDDKEETESCPTSQTE